MAGLGLGGSARGMGGGGRGRGGAPGTKLIFRREIGGFAI